MKGHRKSECPDVQERNKKILKLFFEHHCTKRDIAERFRLSKATVEHIIREEKNRRRF